MPASSHTQRAGFTLLEVLVALAIVAIALAASLRALGSLTNTSEEVRLRMLAQWNIENRMAIMRLQHEWPDTGTHAYACPQAGFIFYCEDTVTNTPNPAFRRVEIVVYARSDKALRLAWMSNVIPNATRPIL